MTCQADRLLKCGAGGAEHAALMQGHRPPGADRLVIHLPRNAVIEHYPDRGTEHFFNH